MKKDKQRCPKTATHAPIADMSYPRKKLKFQVGIHNPLYATYTVPTAEK
jgi:hypothetical protein